MTSVIVPPVDLAPGMPSRVVTISATDVTEGGQSLEGQMVRFALSDTLDVSSGGDVIAKTQAEVVLDSNGEGSIRLPVYDEDVKTWCGKDWAILVTTTWGSQKAIRVPAGTSNIALSALPPVRPLRGRETQWAITGVGVAVVEGPQAGGTVSHSNGQLDFRLTLPPVLQTALLETEPLDPSRVQGTIKAQRSGSTVEVHVDVTLRDDGNHTLCALPNGLVPEETLYADQGGVPESGVRIWENGNVQIIGRSAWDHIERTFIFIVGSSFPSNPSF